MFQPKLNTLPPYPKYRTGNNLEEEFFDFYTEKRKYFDELGYYLIPVFWTTCYIKGGYDIQSYLNTLPSGIDYFCVSQHDDAVNEKLPPNTLSFCAGGNRKGIPIPLVCSDIPKSLLGDEHTERDILCSFVGSTTHPIRSNIYNMYKNDSDFHFNIKKWSYDISNDDLLNFLEISKRSRYMLCPRGYGAQSFRFYEALQLKVIPIYIHDDNIWKPFSDIINWDDFSISIHEKDIGNLKDIISNISPEREEEMRKQGYDIYNNFFRLEKFPEVILKILRNERNK